MLPMSPPPAIPKIGFLTTHLESLLASSAPSLSIQLQSRSGIEFIKTAVPSNQVPSVGLLREGAVRSGPESSGACLAMA